MFEYDKHIVGMTKKYHKKYNFNMNNGASHNNEADAFKHSYLEAELTCLVGKYIAKLLGDYHEYDGNKKGQPKLERNMDLWNNRIGRQIGVEVGSEIKKRNLHPLLFQEDRAVMYDLIAEKVNKALKQNKLILSPNDKRCFNKSNSIYSNITGYAANIEQNEKNNIDTYGINNEELTQYAFENKLFAPENRVFYDGKINPAKIPFGSSEDKYVPQLLEQFESNNKKLPSEMELKQRVNNGELIYVHNYTRSDGTQVSGYYRHKQ